MSELNSIPKNFFIEKKLLQEKGIDSWEGINSLNDHEINELVKGTLGTVRNLKRLRCISIFICELNLEMGHAALLMHSGVASIKSLASLTPQELIKKAGRLERLLQTERNPVVDLQKANLWIKKARQANN